MWYFIAFVALVLFFVAFGPSMARMLDAPHETDAEREARIVEMINDEEARKNVLRR